MTKAAEVYAIPSLRRQIVSFLPNGALARVIYTSQALLLDAAKYLYSTYKVGRTPAGIDNCCSPRIYRAAVLYLNVRPLERLLPEYPHDEPAPCVQPWEVPLVVWKLRNRFPNVRWMLIGLEKVFYCVELDPGAAISGRLAITLWCNGDRTPEAGLDWTQPEGLVTSIKLLVSHPCLTPRRPTANRPSPIWQVFEHLLRTVPFPITMAGLGMNVQPNDLRGILTNSSLSRSFPNFVVAVPASVLGDRLIWQELDSTRRHGAGPRHLVLSPHSTKMPCDALASMVHNVLHLMPTLRRLSLTLDIADSDEAGCLRYLSTDIGQGQLDELTLEIVGKPSGPLFNMIRLLAQMLHKNGTLIFRHFGIIGTVFNDAAPNRFWRSIALMESSTRYIAARADLSAMQLRKYSDIEHLGLDPAGQLVYSPPALYTTNHSVAPAKGYYLSTP